MADVLGYEQSVKMQGAIAQANMAHITVNGGACTLAQSITMDYQNQIQDVQAIGDTSIYWVPGSPSGSMSVTKLTSDSGFFSGWTGGTCGHINSANVNISGNRCNFNGQATLSFSEGIIERLGISINAGQQTITETMSARMTNMTAGGK